MVVCKTLFIGTFTITCLRIRETSFLDDGHDSSEVLGPFPAFAAPLLRRKRLTSIVGIYCILNNYYKKEVLRTTTLLITKDSRDTDITSAAYYTTFCNRQ